MAGITVQKGTVGPLQRYALYRRPFFSLHFTKYVSLSHFPELNKHHHHLSTTIDCQLLLSFFLDFIITNTFALLPNPQSC